MIFKLLSLTKKYKVFLSLFIFLSGCSSALHSKDNVAPSQNQETHSSEKIINLFESQNYHALEKIAQKLNKHEQSKDQKEFLMCILHDDRACIDNYISKMTPHELTSPENSFYSPLWYAAVIAVNKYAVHAMLNKGANPNIWRLTQDKERHRIIFQSGLQNVLNNYYFKKWKRVDRKNKEFKSSGLEQKILSKYKTLSRAPFSEYFVLNDKQELNIPISNRIVLVSDSLEIAELLLEYGAKINVSRYSLNSNRVFSRSSPLSKDSVLDNPSSFGDKQMIVKLIRAGANVNVSRRAQRNAIIRDEPEILDVLIKAGLKGWKSRASVPMNKVAEYLYESGYDELEKGILYSTIRYANMPLFNKVLKESKTFVHSAHNSFEENISRYAQKVMLTNHEHSSEMLKELVDKGLNICSEVKIFTRKGSKNALEYVFNRAVSKRPKAVRYKRSWELFKKYQPNALCWSSIDMDKLEGIK